MLSSMAVIGKNGGHRRVHRPLSESLSDCVACVLETLKRQKQ